MRYEKSIVEKDYIPCVFMLNGDAVGAALILRKLFPMRPPIVQVLIDCFVKSADAVKIVTKGEWEAIIAFELLPIYKGHLGRSQAYVRNISYVTINRLEEM